MAYSTLLTDSKACYVTQVYGNNGHLGTDIQFLPIRWSNVFAPKDGVVSIAAYGSAGIDWSYGWHVEVICTDGTRYRMAHFDSIGVKSGQAISAGQFIGVQGNTGNVEGATGIHLHLEYFVGDARTSPEPLMGFPDAKGYYELEWGSPSPPTPGPGSNKPMQVYMYLKNRRFY